MKFNNIEDYYAYQQPQEIVHNVEFGCNFCWDKKKNKTKELFFLDAANNMRPCTYCPSCGRKYLEV